MSKDKKQQATIILNMNLNRFERLIDKVHNFIDILEEHSCIDDTVEIEFWSDGKINIHGEFSTRYDEDISI